MIVIPYKCRFIIDMLESDGFECFAVGGCVRDSLMGKEPKDWDFTTNALPDDILRIFAAYKTVSIGKEFGTIAVINDGISYEITTYRIEGAYSDSRHPDAVKFSSDIYDDLKRRDFTINSIAYSEKRGLIDPFNGCEDINKCIIRCTGDAYERFSEDALRILRALRFSSYLGFDIEEETEKALFCYKQRLSEVHPNRLRKELSGLIVGERAATVLSKYRDVIGVILPQIINMFDCAQNNPHHMYDVWNHTLKAIEVSPCDEVIRLSLLFHDIGKPYMKTTDEKGIDHFRKHQEKSAEIAEEVLRNFCYPSDMENDIKLLVRYHDERFRKFDVDIKKLLNVIGERLMFLIFDISYCDISAQSDYKKKEKLSHLQNVKTITERIIRNDECYSLKKLNVNGNDLRNLGFDGEEIGTTLNYLLDEVIKGKLKNNKADLIFEAQNIKST